MNNISFSIDALNDLEKITYYIFYNVEIDNIKIIRIIHCNRNFIEILF